MSEKKSESESCFDNTDAAGTVSLACAGNMVESYLDNAATTKPYPEVIDVVCEVMRKSYGNASAQYARGKHAHDLLEQARAVVADALGVDAREVYFTSGGTESNNLAIVGACRAARPERDEIVVSAIEHPSVTKTTRGLKREGWKVSYVGANRGDLDMETLKARLNPKTALITVMSVQNEVGFRMPVADVVRARDELAPGALVHTDAVQAFGKMPFYPRELGVDLASMSAHKVGGPQGIGALYVREGTHMFTTAFGGGHERGLRSGTEAIALIAGFAKAVEITFAHIHETYERASLLKERLLDGVLSLRPDTIVNSRDDGSPFIVSISVPGMKNDDMLAFLDKRGVCVSKSSACETLHPDVPDEDWLTKHPMSLQLAGVPKDMVESTLRMSFSAQTTEDDIVRFVEGFRAFFSECH